MLDKDDVIDLLRREGLFLRPGFRWTDAARMLETYRDWLKLNGNTHAALLLREGVCVRRVEWSDE